MNNPSIEIRPLGASTGTLADLLAANGHALNARCGQRGLCAGCLVDLVEGQFTDAGQKATVPAGPVKSCRLRVVGDGVVRVRIRPTARLGLGAQISESFFSDVPFAFDPLIQPEAGRDTGIAIDLGTTTVVVLLADLTTGEILSRAGGFNAQIRFGDNVITRIGAAASAETRAEMRRTLIEETIAPLVRTACQRAGRDPSRIAGGTLAGNTTMLHILANEDPTPLGIAPFTPRFLKARTMDAAELGILDECGNPLPLHLLPGLAAYLGADISAGIHAAGMLLDESPSLLVDMGTNGELALCAGGRLTGCATAAGPAFEGGGLSCGNRACAGAISRIHLQPDPWEIRCEIIGGDKTAAGICGSAYIDFLARGRACGLLGENGRFDTETWLSLPEHLRGVRDGVRAVLTTGPDGPAITEIDIAHLLQAKAAIGSGIETLFADARISATDIGRVYLAGGFGMHVSVPHAIAIGLLPGFDPDRVRVSGNTSLAGALMALLDRSAMDAMDAMRRDIGVVELNLVAGFEDCYIRHLELPENR
jgi:uncharacterized 2Fe-2S/4Fe-4S cluster protein (DUF4445 family)